MMKCILSIGCNIEGLVHGCIAEKTLSSRMNRSQLDELSSVCSCRANSEVRSVFLAEEPMRSDKEVGTSFAQSLRSAGAACAGRLKAAV